MKKGNSHTFKSRHFHMRETTMTHAFRRSFGGVDVGKPTLVREARLMHIKPEGKRNIIHAVSN